MNLVERAKKILLTPKTEWPVVAGEEPNIMLIFTGYVLPLAVIPAVAMIIGYGMFETAFGQGLSWGIAHGIAQFLSAFVVVYLTAFVIDILAPNFGSQRNVGRAVQLVAYSFTPVWVAGILNIIPVIGWLASLISLYGLYLMYLGLPPLMKTPEDKAVPYLVVSVIVLFIVYFVIAAIISAIVVAILGVGMVTGIR
jgi:hypothetical protein